MNLIPSARMVEIRILKVPYSWKGIAPKNETVAEDNIDKIVLVHEPSGTEFVVSANAEPLSKSEVMKCRAEAKLEFIHKLHGEP
tara:strand:+ start:61 stop:312 length:252 start_codon:yes stop_codon:yes gene_type:complete